MKFVNFCASHEADEHRSYIHMPPKNIGWCHETPGVDGMADQAECRLCVDLETCHILALT